MQQVTEFWMIRHAPGDDGGRLAGRRDVAALLPAGLAGFAPPVDRVLASPARRCLQTAQALFPGRAPDTDARLWEQDFGAWEGLPHAELPDPGLPTREAMARHRPEGGESFADLCARVWPCLDAQLPGRVAVVAHAGTIRAALSRVLEDVPAGLAFHIAPLSLTRITASPGGWAVVSVNAPLP